MALLVGRSCTHPEREYSASAAQATELKNQIEDVIGKVIATAAVNIGETGVVPQAKVIRGFFHDRFVPIEGYWDRNTNVFIYTSTTTECGDNPKCYGFLVHPLTYKNGTPIFAIWHKAALTIHPTLDMADGYTPYRVLQELYYAWGEDTRRFVMPPPSMPKPDTSMPWETESRIFLSMLFNAATGGAYGSIIEQTAMRVINDDGISYEKPDMIVFVDMPEELFTFLAENDQPTLSKASRDRLLELATIDLNRAIIARTEADPAERAHQLDTLISNFANESLSPDAKMLWRSVVNRE